MQFFDEFKFGPGEIASLYLLKPETGAATGSLPLGEYVYQVVAICDSHFSIFDA